MTMVTMVVAVVAMFGLIVVVVVKVKVVRRALGVAARAVVLKVVKLRRLVVPDLRVTVVVSVVVAADERADSVRRDPESGTGNDQLLGLAQAGSALLELGALGLGVGLVAELEAGVIVLEGSAGSCGSDLGVEHLVGRIVVKEWHLRHGWRFPGGGWWAVETEKKERRGVVDERWETALMHVS